MVVDRLTGEREHRRVFVTDQTQRETTHDTAAPTHDRRHDRSRTRREHQEIVPQLGCRARTSLSSQPRPDLRSGSPGLPPPFARTEGVDLAELQLRSPRRPLPVPHHTRFARPALLCAGCQDAVHPASDPQPRRARAAVYRDHQPQASRLADDGLRRRAPGERAGATTAQRYRLRTHVSARRSRQGQ